MTNAFSDSVIDQACGMEVAMIGSYAFHVRRRAGAKVFKVQTDVIDYMYCGDTLDSSFAHCNCARGKRTKDRNGNCVHIAAVYMAVAQELEEDNDESE